MMRAIWRSAAVAAAIAAGAASAQAQAEGKAEMAEKVRALALAIGNAYACTPEQERGLFKEEAHHLFDLIVQDVGSDMGFLYATGVGYGGAVPAQDLDCARLLEQWQGIRVDYDLIGDEE
ncbi:MAG TPA: hypothetical protein VJ994_08935 [Paracoccaceae bacterium]|nr:hypothetical protein [Paracoccaceae bacterium]